MGSTFTGLCSLVRDLAVQTLIKYSFFNTTALIKAKLVYNVVLSECNMVNCAGNRAPVKKG